MFFVPKLKTLKDGFVFVTGGIVAVIVGCFMLRGTMHMWDKKKQEKDG